MAIHEVRMRAPTYYAVQYNGTNGQELADFIGQGFKVYDEEENDYVILCYDTDPNHATRFISYDKGMWCVKDDSGLFQRVSTETFVSAWEIVSSRS